MYSTISIYYNKKVISHKAKTNNLKNNENIDIILTISLILIPNYFKKYSHLNILILFFQVARTFCLALLPEQLSVPSIDCVCVSRV